MHETQLGDTSIASCLIQIYNYQYNFFKLYGSSILGLLIFASGINYFSIQWWSRLLICYWATFYWDRKLFRPLSFIHSEHHYQVMTVRIVILICRLTAMWLIMINSGVYEITSLLYYLPAIHAIHIASTLTEVHSRHDRVWTLKSINKRTEYTILGRGLLHSIAYVMFEWMIPLSGEIVTLGYNLSVIYSR